MTAEFLRHHCTLFSSCALLTTVVWMLAMPGRSKCEFIIGLNTQSHEDARRYCDKQNAPLPRPDNVSLTAILERMHDAPLHDIWIAPRLSVTPWYTQYPGNVADCRLTSCSSGAITWLRDQGCYNQRDLTAERAEIEKNESACLKRCRHSGHDFAALQLEWKTDSWVSCICAMDVPTLSRLHERNCSQPNPSGRYGDKNLTSYRVLATNPNSHDIKWSDRGTRVGLCAVSRSIVSDGRLKTVEQSSCDDSCQSPCCIAQAERLLEKGSWSDSQYECHRLGGEFSLPISTCTDPVRLVPHGKYWTSIRAWKWNVPDGDDLGSVYTNWGPDQPDFTVGACVELTERGLWRTADCNELKHFLCETQPTTPASTWTAIVDEPRSPPSSGKEEALAFPALFSSAMADNDWSLSSTNDSTEHQAIHTDVAAGATMGGLILVVIVCLAILIFVRKKKGSLNSRVTLKASAEMTYPHRDRPSATWDGVRCSEETAVRVPASDLWQVGGGINETEMVENEVYNQALHGDAPQEACVMVDNELYGHL